MPSPVARVVPLVLLLAAMGALWLGHFIQFDDATGFGADLEDPALGAVAFTLACAAVLIAVAHRPARRVTGLTLALIAALAVAGSVLAPAFRFVELGDGLTPLLVVISSAATMLLTTSSTPLSDVVRTPRGRVPTYVVVLGLAVLGAFFVGGAVADPGCGGGECDLAGLAGLWLAFAVLVIGVGTMAIVEVAFAVRRHRGGR